MFCHPLLIWRGLPRKPSRTAYYYARGRAYAISFKQREVVLAKLGSGRRGVAIGMRFVGANPHAQISAEHPLATTVSYLRGDRRSSFAGLRTFGQIVYRNLWPGIDLAFVGVGGKLKYAFTLRPGADPRAIRFAYDDVKTQALDRRGNLLLSTAIGVMRDARPIAYQATSPVRARFVLQRSHASKVVSFAVGTYDSRRPLVIDPGITYSTYLGGAAFDGGLAIAVDSAGSAYVTGRTESTNFPTTPGAFHVTTSGAGDVFVTKFSPSGSSVAYSTFLGGTSLDEGRGIAVDAGGNAYVTGYTDSANFPTTAGAFDRSYGGGRDGFALKLSPSGSTLVYSTFFGGSSTDKGLALAIDSSGTSYITGETNSASFPTTTGSFDPTWNGDFDAFVIALNSSGSPVYSTFLGGGGFDDGLAITVDGSRAAYVTGKASPGFPVTPGAFDVAQNGGYDAFVTKLDSTGSRLVYSTYLGGNAWDEGLGLAVDGTGNAFLTGNVQSPNFPTTSGAFDTQLGDSIDAFLTKVNPAGSGLVYSTYLGGSSWDEGDGLGIDSSGNAYVAGHLASTDFPTTANAADRTENGNVDAFLTKVSPNGSSLAYSTYLGSSGWDGGFGLAVDSAGAGYVTGFTGSSQFPTTSGAFDTTWNGGTDVFVTKIDTSTAPPPAPDFSLSATPALQQVVRPNAVSYTVTVTPESGFNGAVTLSVSGLPSSTNASFNPNPATSSSVLTVKTTSSTPPGSFTLTLSGTSGGLTRTATVDLKVHACC